MYSNNSKNILNTISFFYLILNTDLFEYTYYLNAFNRNTDTMNSYSNIEIRPLQIYGQIHP